MDLFSMGVITVLLIILGFMVVHLYIEEHKVKKLEGGETIWYM